MNHLSLLCSAVVASEIIPLGLDGGLEERMEEEEKKKKEKNENGETALSFSSLLFSTFSCYFSGDP
jgi:hypothetical protein